MHDQKKEHTGVKSSNATLIVNCPSGSIIRARSEHGERVADSNENGIAVLEGLRHGVWTIIMTDGVQTATETINIVTDYEMTIDFFAASISITYPAGSICTCTDGNTTYTAPDSSGLWVCIVPSAGPWVVHSTNGEQSKSKTIDVIKANQIVDVSIVYFSATINVTYPVGAVCVCSDGFTTYSAEDETGFYSFTVSRPGQWIITASNDEQTECSTVIIMADEQVEDIVIYFFAATIEIAYPYGSVCTCTDGITVYTAPDTSGSWNCVVPRMGTWLIKAYSSMDVDSQTVDIIDDGQKVNVTCAFFRSYINVTYPPETYKVVLWYVDSYGAKEQISVDATSSGAYQFIVRQAGSYEIGGYRVEPYIGIESSAGDYANSSTIISNSGQYVDVSLMYNAIPDFTYVGGTYKIVDDDGTVIDKTTGNWKIQFLTSGVFKTTKLKGARNGIYIFVLGGGGNGGKAYMDDIPGFGSGGGGGGGGHYVNSFDVSIEEIRPYEIKIGGPGGTSEAFGSSASPGNTGGDATGANNMDGGGKGGTGGKNGGDGAVCANANGSNGEDGVCAFLEESGTRYAPGGAGGYGFNVSLNENSPTYYGGKDGGGDSGADATVNSGGGGGGGGHTASGVTTPGGKGGSGIVIIRNTR